MYKRKRGPFGGGGSFKARAGPMKKRRTTSALIVPGVTRTGGYYGRYAGGSGELKFHDVDVDDAVVAAGGNIVNSGTVIVIPQGTTEKTRVGRKCTLRSLHLRYLLTLPEQDAVATPANGDTVRLIIYLDKQCNGATIAVTDLLESDNIHSFRNLSNSSRFVVLCDKIHNVNYAGMASDGAGIVSQAATTNNYTWNKKCNIPIEYSSTTGAVGEIRSNNIGIMLVGNSGVVGWFSQWRCRYSDGS